MSKGCLDVVITHNKPLVGEVSIANPLLNDIAVSDVNNHIDASLSLVNIMPDVAVSIKDKMRVAITNVCGVSYDYSGLVYVQDGLLIFRDGKKLNVLSSKK